MNNVTMSDVARLAEVSTATVSMVLSGNKRISEQTRQKVLGAVTKLNYVPNEIGRSLRSHKTETIALIIPQTPQHVFSHPYFSHLLEGVGEVLDRHNYNLLLSTTPMESNESAAYDKVLRNRRADGIIVSSASLNDKNFLRLIDSGFPFVYLGRVLNNEVITVERDDIGGAHQATEHLIRLGRRRIAHFSGPLNHQAGQDRLEGYKMALQDNGISFDSSLILEKDFSKDAGYAGASELLENKIKFDAIFAGNDLMAIGALKLFREKGIRVPDDVAIVGFDDIEMAEVTYPSLTTIHQPMKQVGVIATELLLAELNGQKVEEKRRVLPTKLVIRESCGGLSDN